MHYVGPLQSQKLQPERMRFTLDQESFIRLRRFRHASHERSQSSRQALATCGFADVMLQVMQSQGRQERLC